MNIISLHRVNRFWRLCACLLSVLSSYACRSLSLPPTPKPTIETMIKQAVRADCPSASFDDCDTLLIDSMAVDYMDHHYHLVRIPLPFEALADVISVRLVKCDDLYTVCSVVDRYDGEFGVVEIITDAGQPRLHWEPFSP